jgi:hypothetical protein
MAVDDLDLDLRNVRSLPQVLERTPNGTAVAELAGRLGLVGRSLSGSVDRKAFITNVAELSAPQLSNEQSYWTSEFGRIVELIGLLQGQEKYLVLQGKSVRASARARVRREIAAEEGDSGKKAKATVGEVNDRAEEDPAVRDLEEKAALVQILLATASAAKEATAMYLQSLSREISFRCAQMDAKIYG